MFFFDRPDLQIASQNSLFRKLVDLQPDADIAQLVQRHPRYGQNQPLDDLTDDGAVQLGVS